MSQERTDQDTERDADSLGVPSVIVLGDAASLTRGSDADSVESKQNPYD